MRIYYREKAGKKIWFGSVLGSIWVGLGEVLRGIWSLLGPLGLFWGLFFSCLYLEWSSKALLEASGSHFDSILRGLGGVWGGFWVRFEGQNWVTLCLLCLLLLSLAFSCFLLFSRGSSQFFLRFPFHRYSGFSYVGSFFALGAHFFDFFSHLKSSCVFLTVFCDFSWIFGVLGRVLGGILGEFSVIFRNFSQFLWKTRFWKNMHFP